MAPRNESFERKYRAAIADDDVVLSYARGSFFAARTVVASVSEHEKARKRAHNLRTRLGRRTTTPLFRHPVPVSQVFDG